MRVFNGGARIDEADLPRLFEPFYRAEQSRSRATGGSGLGLYLVRRILELHGVECAIKNTSEGVLFAATLPEDQGFDSLGEVAGASANSAEGSVQIGAPPSR